MIRLKDANLKEVGSTVAVKALVRSITEGKTKNGGTYLTLVLVDNSVHISCKLFNLERAPETLLEGEVVEAELKVQDYKGTLSYLVNDCKSTLDKPDDYVNWFLKFPALKIEFNKLLNSINDEVYRTVVLELINRVGSDFDSVPAAKSMHHVEFGGCLAHSTLVALNCRNMAVIYNSVYSGDELFVDVDLVVSAALIHDMAKTFEYEWDSISGSVDYCKGEECLESHITKLGEWLTLIANEKGLLENRKYKLLRHCALAHHGKMEWGSPVVPAIPEAYIVSMCDYIDANMWRYFDKIQKLEDNESGYCSIDGVSRQVFRK